MNTFLTIASLALVAPTDSAKEGTAEETAAAAAAAAATDA